MGQFAALNADASVCDRDEECLFLETCFNCDASFVRVLDSVRQEVDEDLLDSVTVSHELEWKARVDDVVQCQLL